MEVLAAHEDLTLLGTQAVQEDLTVSVPSNGAGGSDSAGSSGSGESGSGDSG